MSGLGDATSNLRFLDDVMKDRVFWKLQRVPGRKGGWISYHRASAIHDRCAVGGYDLLLNFDYLFPSVEGIAD